MERIKAPCDHWSDNLFVECTKCQNLIFCIDRAKTNTDPALLVDILRSHIVKLTGGQE